jgi:hypothetical protein
VQVGLSAPDKALSRAFFRQACHDFRVGESLKRREFPVLNAAAVAQFQQSCEKALKAVVIKEAGRQLYQTVKLSHTVWARELQHHRLKDVKKTVASLFEAKSKQRSLDIGTSEELENFAPTGDWEHENTEYPWVTKVGDVATPMDWFESRQFKVVQFSVFTGALLKRIKHEFAPFFDSAWDADQLGRIGAEISE